MKVAFMGSSEFGAIALRALARSSHSVVFVITGPDKPKGRGMCCEPGPVRIVAEEFGYPLIQPLSIKEQEVREKLADISPDIIVVVCYGEYIPQAIFNAPPFKSINVHPSLLPRWRGASPIHYALLAGDTMTGVTVQYIAKRMDAGDILLQSEVPIDPDENHGCLSARLHNIGAEMLIETLDRLEKGNISPFPQDDSKATNAPKITKADLNLNWSLPANDVRNRIRAFAPEPGAKVQFKSKQYKILEAASRFVAIGGNSQPGMIVQLSPEGPVVACLDAGLVITRLQPAGKKAMSGKDFINGYRPKIGDLFENPMGVDED